MAERQYIGARYVPVFADPVEWDNVRQYEALTIVTHLGNSFTSRKPVPAGVDITNGEYWVNTGNYNEQVEVYRQQVEAVNADVEKLKNQVDRSKYLFLGDSYASPVYGDWIKYAAAYLGLQSGEYWNLAQDGSNIASGLWLGYIKNWVAANTTEIKNVGTIVCGGGINDSDATNFPKLADALQELISYCKNTFGNAVHVKLFYFGWALDTSPIIAGRTANYRSVTQNAYSMCAKYGGEYIPGGETILHNRNYLDNDGLHPNTLGGQAIGWIVANGCKVGANSVNNYRVAEVTPINGNVNGAVMQYLCNNVNTITFNELNIAFNTPVAIDGNNWVDVANIKLPMGNSMPATATTLLLAGDGKLVNASCWIRVQNDKLQIIVREWDNTTNQYLAMNCTNINTFALVVNGLAMND